MRSKRVPDGASDLDALYEYYELINTCNNRSQLQQLVVVETTIADARILSGGERSGGNATVDTFAVII